MFSGAEEAIFVTANVLLGQGDHAIVVWPSYQSLHEIARAAGADVTLHELRAAEGWAIDVDLLRRQVTPRTKLIVVNVPHDPTGALPDRRDVRGLVDIAADAGAHLLSDEVYRGLQFDPMDQLPAGADVWPAPAISVGVMSKSFAMAGLRIGWLATARPRATRPPRGSRTTRRSAPPPQRRSSVPSSRCGRGTRSSAGRVPS